MAENKETNSDHIYDMQVIDISTTDLSNKIDSSFARATSLTFMLWSGTAIGKKERCAETPRVNC